MATLNLASMNYIDWQEQVYPHVHVAYTVLGYPVERTLTNITMEKLTQTLACYCASGASLVSVSLPDGTLIR